VSRRRRLVRAAPLLLVGTLACAVPPDTTADATTSPTSSTPAVDPSGSPASTASPFAVLEPRAVRTEVVTWVDPSRVTPAAGVTPETPGRTLETWLFVPDGDGPFPLIAFAHGFAGHPDKFTDLLETWASHGYVVVAPAFPLTNDKAAEPVAGLPDLVDQPGDLSFVIDQALAANQPGGELEGLIDPERIGAGGLSLGGGTTYGLIYNDCCRDGRIDAVQILAGADFPLPGEFDFTTGPPILIVHGTADPAIPIATADRLAAVIAPPVWYVTLLDGLHAQPFENAESPHDEMVEQFTTDFWDVFLRGDASRLDALRTNAEVEGLSTLVERD